MTFLIMTIRLTLNIGDNAYNDFTFNENTYNNYTIGNDILKIAPHYKCFRKVLS
jgi:hypothetical protein